MSQYSQYSCIKHNLNHYGKLTMPRSIGFCNDNGLIFKLWYSLFCDVATGDKSTFLTLRSDSFCVIRGLDPLGASAH